MVETPLTGLVLSGGGARAAYQVGVLRAIARLRRERLRHRARLSNPFGIITGTSAGAINAASLACNADTFEGAVEVLGRVWENFSADQVYRADALGMLRTGARWLTMLSAGWLIARWRKLRPRSLLDNAPLADLLRQAVPLQRLPMLLQQGHLKALAVTASSYSTGEHVTFYSAAQRIEPWLRSQRIALPTEQIGIEHLLASSAIPFIFPAARVPGPGGHTGWFGDGSMRQSAPLSPAIHLGAERLLIIGAGRMHEPPANAPRHPHADYPSLAQIAGHAMSSIFLDALTVDIERMQRINRTLALLPDHVRQDTPLRPVESLVISPSQRIDDIATRHLDNLPTPVRALLRGVGVGGVGPDARGAALASYLLFEAPFTRELMALGEADTMARADEVYQFFAWPDARATRKPAAAPAPAPAPASWEADTLAGSALPIIGGAPDIVLP